MADGTLKFDTKIDTSGFTKDMQKMAQEAENGMKDASEKLKDGMKEANQSTGQGTQQISNKFAGMGTLMAKYAIDAMSKVVSAIADGFKQMISDSMDFQASLVKVQSLGNNTAEEMKAFGDTLLEVSNKTGESSQVLAEGFYNVQSAGFAGQEGIDVLTQSAKLAKGGFTDTQSAASALTSILNAYGMEATESAHLTDVLINTQNLGVTTVNELASSMFNVIPTASSLGVSIEEVASSMVSMTKQGTPTAQATTQLNALLNELSNGSTKGAQSLQKAADGTKYAGKSFRQMQEAGLTLGEAMAMVSQYSKDTGIEMTELFSSTESAKSAMQIGAQGAVEFTNALEIMTDSTKEAGKATEDAMNTVNSSTKAQLDMAKNTIKNFGIAIGQNFEDGMNDAVKFVNEGIQDIYTAFKQDGWDGALDAGVKMIDKFVQGISDNAPQIAENVLDGLNHMLEAVQTIFPTLVEGGIQIVSSLIEGFTQNAPQILSTVVDMLGQILMTIAMNLPNLIVSGIDMINALIMGIVQNFPAIITYATEAIISFIQGIGQNLPYIITTGVEIVLNLISGLLEALPQLLASGVQIIFELGKALVMAIPDALAGVAKGIGDFFGGLWNTITGQNKEGVEETKSTMEDMNTSITQQAEEATSSVIASFEEMGYNLPTTAESIATGAGSSFEEMANEIRSSTGTAKDEAIANFNAMQTDASASMDTLRANIEASTAGASTSAQNNFSVLSTNISSTMDTASASAKSGSQQTATAIETNLSKAEKSASKSASNIADSVNKSLDKMPTYATQAMEKVNAGISSGGATATVTAKGVAQNILSAFRSITDSAYSAGQSIGQSLANGLNASLGAVKSASSSLASASKPTKSVGYISAYNEASESGILSRSIDRIRNSIQSAPVALSGSLALAGGGSITNIYKTYNSEVNQDFTTAKGSTPYEIRKQTEKALSDMERMSK